MRLICLLLLISVSSFCADFNISFPHTIRVEGETFTRIHLDKGGATKYGITIMTYSYWCNGKKITVVVCDKDGDGKITAKDLNRVTLEDVKPIYKINYWDVALADQINNQAVAEIIVDFFINSGASGRNIRLIQKLLNVTQDGHFGPVTIKAINKQDPQKLFKKIHDFRIKFYTQIVKNNPSQRKFLKGWKNRLITLKTMYTNEKLL
ncbi:glycoside hydrolase family 108 protein [Flectobacillus roseus]|uniref:glycoside hydrolase family 108 protein n=1 Tax=Flectobacillus roseus TaxID=502259 RepID=UPI0024B74DDD|nr:glycosyl hydrolase 108 family protein [Flectobacillus roseus]MDI9872235.1 putative peptidoglycan-binding domain-containing protein [Flectobacillus roseus]